MSGLLPVPQTQPSYSLANAQGFGFNQPNLIAAPQQQSLAYGMNTGPNMNVSGTSQLLPDLNLSTPVTGLAGQPRGMLDNFFTKGNSFMDNAGQVIGLAGGVASLASLLDNWGLQKDAFKLNSANINQQMSQNKTAFDRSVKRQDGTSSAIAKANAIANERQGYGG